MKFKFKEWFWRYAPAETMAIIGAVVCAVSVLYLTQNRVLAALAGTWGDNFGFYGYRSLMDILESRQKHKKSKKVYGIIPFLKNLRNLIFEFGPAETLDSFLIRPAYMYFFPLFMNNFALGILAANIAANITFYIPTIIAYELRKKLFRD